MNYNLDIEDYNHDGDPRGSSRFAVSSARAESAGASFHNIINSNVVIVNIIAVIIISVVIIIQT